MAVRFVSRMLTVPLPLVHVRRTVNTPAPTRNPRVAPNGRYGRPSSWPASSARIAYASSMPVPVVIEHLAESKSVLSREKYPLAFTITMPLVGTDSTTMRSSVTADERLTAWLPPEYSARGRTEATGRGEPLPPPGPDLKMKAPRLPTLSAQLPCSVDISMVASTCTGVAPSVVLERLRETAFVPTEAFVGIHAALGNRDDAFTWLERSAADRSISYYLFDLRYEDLYRPLREDPRLARLFQTMGLELAGPAVTR